MKRKLLFLLMVFSCYCAYAQNLTEFKLAVSDGSSGDTFGFAVAISGDYAFIGANEVNFSTGAVYVFHHDETAWQYLSKLVPTDVAPTGYYGFSVAIDGDYVVVGARNDDDNGAFSGAVYIYERDGSTWPQVAKIIADDGRPFDYFGNAVAVSGNYIIAGAPGDDVSAGAAFIVQRDSGTSEWLLHQKLTASDRAPNELFGISAALSGSYAIIGALADDAGGFQSGSAYIFKRENAEWRQQIKLTASDAAAEDVFGVAVGISGDYAIVGAMGNDQKAPGAGAAYLFKYDSTANSWQEQAKLLASNGKAQDQFGNAVAISGDYAIVGALMQFNSGKGAAYIFKRDGENWVEQYAITASDGAINDRFGNAVSISGGQAIIGARYDDDDGENSGAAYIYSGFATTVGISDDRNELPTRFMLKQNYPNPFNPVTAISYQLSAISDEIFAASKVEITIHNITGRKVLTLVREIQTPGIYTVRWDGRDSIGREAVSGVYFYRLVLDGIFSETRKMVKLR